MRLHNGAKVDTALQLFLRKSLLLPGSIPRGSYFALTSGARNRFLALVNLTSSLGLSCRWELKSSRAYCAISRSERKCNRFISYMLRTNKAVKE